MTSNEIQKRIEEVEEMPDRGRDELKFPKQQTLATLEVALQLAHLAEVLALK